MTIFLAANGLAGFRRSHAEITEVTKSGRFDSRYVDRAISFPTVIASARPYVEADFDAPATGRVYAAFSAFTTGSNLNSGSNQIIFQLGNAFRFGLFSAAVRAQYWNGSSWVDGAASGGISIETLYRFKLAIELGVGFELHIGEMLYDSGSFSGSPPSSASFARYGQFGSSLESNTSDMLITDYDCREDHVLTDALNGNSSANTGQASGGYADIHKLGVNDATAMVINTPGNRGGVTKAGVTVPSGYEIAAMVINARARVGGTVTDGSIGVRSAGANYSGAAQHLTGAYGPMRRIATADPAGGKWTQTKFNNPEIYFEAGN